MNEAVTGRDAALAALAASGVHVTTAALADISRHGPELYRKLREREPCVVIVEAPDVESLDVMALRWMFKGGVTPLVLCPASAAECAELATTAAKAATLLRVPAFLLLEDDVAEEELAGPPPSDFPALRFEHPAPQDQIDQPEDDAEVRELDALLSSPPLGFDATRLDRHPRGSGRPEWLVVSYGAASRAAGEAVARAREQGQRVDLLRTRLLWPLPEAELLRATAGIKHVVVAERNLGQYAQEVRRMLPGLPVIVAGGVGKLASETVMRRLARSPRCC
ncbi:MAG: hypothetical protein KF696_00330 [Planctomycetes bacterium]|nr:hypothetical protein [Planctomycetota bacterium]MCW8134615.1 hypothetical protein [Planctomycetota bacterium]